MSTILNHTITYQLVRTFIIGLLLITLATILINMSITENAYTVASLTQQVQQLTETVNTAETINHALASPELLSQKAENLGMVISETTNIITVK